MQILFAHDGLNISKDHNCLLRCRRSKAAGGTCLFPESFSSSYSGLIIFLVPQESGLPINLHQMVDICWSPHLGSVISPPSHRFMLPAEKSQSALSAGIGQPQGARKCSNALCRKWGLVPMPHSKASMQGLVQCREKETEHEALRTCKNGKGQRDACHHQSTD
jgi:hypothetical protein